jgi:hypothetical protein
MIPRRFPIGALLTAALLAVLYLIFLAILAAWIGIWTLVGSPSALSILGWTSDPYDNIFIRAAVWLGVCLIVSLIIPLAADRFAARFPSGPRRFLATALIAWVVIVAGHLLWMAFVHLVHAQTDLAFAWHIDELINNPLLRAVPMSLLFTACETVQIDAEANRAADSPTI